MYILVVSNIFTRSIYPLCRNPSLPVLPPPHLTNHQAPGAPADFLPQFAPASCCPSSPNPNRVSEPAKLLMLLRPDITLQLVAALVDPQLPCSRNWPQGQSCL